MDLTEEDILKILSWLEQSNWDELRFESGSFKLAVSRSGRPLAAAAAAAAQPASARVPAPPPPPPAPVTASAQAPADHAWVAVRAPMLGTFYVAPKPGAPPFVSVGAQVAEDDTVGILEVMKLMNSVKAGVRGRVVRVCATNGELVEFDDALIYIDPRETG